LDGDAGVRQRLGSRLGPKLSVITHGFAEERDVVGWAPFIIAAFARFAENVARLIRTKMRPSAGINFGKA
jgi:hypothetical protein